MPGFPRLNIVLQRYDDPEPKLGVHYTEGTFKHSTLCSPEALHRFFILGNEIEYTMEDIYYMIPIEWKNPKNTMCTEAWIRGRVTAYDSIIPRPETP